MGLASGNVSVLPTWDSVFQTPAGVCAVLVAQEDMDHFTSEVFIAVMCPTMILALLSAC